MRFTGRSWSVVLVGIALVLAPSLPIATGGGWAPADPKDRAEPDGPVLPTRAVQTGQALLDELDGVIDGDHGDTLGTAAGSAKLAAGFQLDRLGIAAQKLPEGPDHDRPSEAIFALLAAHGQQPGTQLRSDALAWDDLPGQLAGALTEVLDAFLVYQTVATGSGPTDLGLLIPARGELLGASVALARAAEATPVTPAQAPPLIVASPYLSLEPGLTDTHHKTDVALSIDLGGDDRYTNNAGGNGISHGELTDLVELGGRDRCGGWLVYEPGMSAAAAIDVGGSDTYGSFQRGCGANGGTYRDGAGFLVDLGGGDDRYQRLESGVNGGAFWGGHGFLVDDGGDDRYTSYFSPWRITPGYGGVNGGATSASAPGTGFLLDGGGDDVYLAGDYAVNGGGGYRANGLLVDLAGHDRYTAGASGVNGGGVDLGRGALIDVAGDDTYLAAAGGANGGASPGDGTSETVCSPVTCERIQIPPLASAGLLLDGGGTDRYEDEEDGTGQDQTVVPKGTVGAQVDLGP